MSTNPGFVDSDTMGGWDGPTGKAPTTLVGEDGPDIAQADALDNDVNEDCVGLMLLKILKRVSLLVWFRGRAMQFVKADDKF